MRLCLRPVLRPLCVLLFAAALLLPLACHKAAAPVETPEPFTGQLTEVEGVQAIVSLRHPKLVNEDLGKLMAGVPETAMARLLLMQFSTFGYPQFSEIAAGSNVGVAVLNLTAADLTAKTTVAIGFAKLQENGKLWALLAARGLVLQKHGEWVLIGQDAASIAKLKSPNAVIAYLEKPQTEDLRLWGRLSPEFLASLKASAQSGLDAQLPSLSADERKAAQAYCDVLFSLLGQIHSADISLAFADDAIKLSYGIQMLPDSAFGIFLRYPPGPVPEVAQYVSGDAFGTLSFRQKPRALLDLSNAILDALIAVDYPPVADRLKEIKASRAAILESSSGGGVAAFNLGYGPKDGRNQISPDYFYVMGGNFTPEMARNYFKQIHTVTEQVSQLMRAKVKAVPGVAGVQVEHPYVENAATVEGCAFDSLTTAMAMNGQELSSQTQLGGVAGGNLVIATSETTLKARLPALLAKTPLPDAIRVPDIAGEIGHGEFNGAKFVDLLVEAAKLDLTNPDTKAQVDGFRAEYAAAGPASVSVTAGQAGAKAVFAVPYKLIESSIHLGQYMAAQKFNFASLFMPALPTNAHPPGRRPRPAASAPAPASP
jgi:hypothetical protein